LGIRKSSQDERSNCLENYGYAAGGQLIQALCSTVNADHSEQGGHDAESFAA
jgi:hypothetical protein